MLLFCLNKELRAFTRFKEFFGLEGSPDPKKVHEKGNVVALPTRVHGFRSFQQNFMSTRQQPQPEANSETSVEAAETATDGQGSTAIAAESAAVPEPAEPAESGEAPMDVDEGTSTDDILNNTLAEAEAEANGDVDLIDPKDGDDQPGSDPNDAAEL